VTSVSLTIGVDIGGTKVLGGVVDPLGNVIETERQPTPADDVAATRDTIVAVARELASKYNVEAVGIGAAGWIDVSRSNVLFAPNLAWRHEPLRDYVQASLGLPVVVENDANAAAWAEFRFGAAEDTGDSMVMFTVGTGIGGGIVMGGQLLRGAHGIAAEVGHVLTIPDGYPCGCGRHGCLEQYASGRALVRFARAAAETTPERAELLLSKAGGDPGEITGLMVTAAAMSGDEVAIEAFNEIGKWLGQGLVDIVQLLDPQVLVIGGGVIEAGELLMAPTRVSFRESLAQRGNSPVGNLRATRLGNNAGVIGAADLARQR
jgi:glucokinase